VGEELTGGAPCRRSSNAHADAQGAVLDWTELTGITHLLSRAVATHGVPHVVVGILRGGIIPAVLLAHTFGLRDVRAIEVTHTTSDRIDAGKTPHPRVRNPVSLGDLTGLDVLIVDDVAGTGQSLATTAALVRAAGAARTRTAVCAVNEINWFQSRDLDPEQALTYVGRRCRGWVVLPWERQ
jgi:hypoxanthine phosphoribosyltransferase